MVNTSRIARKVIEEVLPKLPRIRRTVEDASEEFIEIIEEYAPLTRPLGLPEIFPSDVKPSGVPEPLVKTYQFTPTIPDKPFTGSVRFVPQPKKETETMTRREEDKLQNQLQEMFDRLPTEGEQELAYLTIRENNERFEQNQTLENALARMAADRPRQFSNQFSRQELLPPIKKKRKVSKYQKRFGIELKKLKKLHPRTKIQNLMKRAHRRTKAALK